MNKYDKLLIFMIVAMGIFAMFSVIFSEFIHAIPNTVLNQSLTNATNSTGNISHCGVVCF